MKLWRRIRRSAQRSSQHSAQHSTPVARRFARAREPTAYAAIEIAAQRAAALLRGGVPAVRVWRVLSEERARQADSQAMTAIRDRLSSGVETAEALAAAGGPEWRVLAASWRVAELSGAPLAPMLDRFAESMRALGRLSAHRGVLLAGPRSTVRLVIALPPLALLMASLLGFDPLPALASPVGATVVALGTVLLLVGALWASAMTRRVARTDWVAGWEFELVAIALGGGAPPVTALRRAVDCADLAGAEWVRLECFVAQGEIETVVQRGQSLGAPLGPMLLAEAERSRLQAQSELERAAERLGVAVLLPLGACVLPAFVLLGVVPVLLAVLGGAGF